jgi:hypothetical protein
MIIFLAIVGLFLGTNGFTQEKKGDIAGKTADGQGINAFMVEKIIGSKVINLVIDIDTGRIVYAVIESGGFLSIGDKLFPVPWDSLAALPSEGIFFLNQSKEQMAKAPAFDKNKLPDMADMRWGEDTFKHYGIPGYEQGEPMKEDYYKKIFDFKTIKTISGQVIKVDQVPEAGFGMDMRLTVIIDKKEILPVYLGPVLYIVGPDQAKPFNIGDKVTVSGSQVTVRGESFMLATTVRRGNEVLRLRDKDGTPEWVGWKKTKD